MKLIKKSAAATAIALLAFAANSGHADSTNAPASGRYASVTSQPYDFTVGAEAGTLGAGVAANWRFADHLGVGGGFDHARITGNRKINGVTYGATVRFMSEPLTLDLYPWKKSSFRVSAGVMFNQFDLNGTAIVLPGTLDGKPYAGGVLALSIKQQPAAPYLAVCENFYFDRAHHWSVSGALGVVYTGEPRVSLTSSTPDTTGAVASEQMRVKRYARDAAFWPVVKVGINYSF